MRSCTAVSTNGSTLLSPMDDLGNSRCSARAAISCLPGFLVLLDFGLVAVRGLRPDRCHRPALSRPLHLLALSPHRWDHGPSHVVIHRSLPCFYRAKFASPEVVHFRSAHGRPVCCHHGAKLVARLVQGQYIGMLVETRRDIIRRISEWWQDRWRIDMIR